MDRSLGSQASLSAGPHADHQRRGLIDFKLQGLVNDATRTREQDDIRALMKIHRAALDMDALREYFALFNKAELLNDLLG
jgi:hypothetical protein